MIDVTRTRANEFALALCQFLDGAEDAARLQAYEVARDAMAASIGLLEIVADHEQALGIVLAESPTPPECRRTANASAQLLEESLGPYEMAHRGYQEANAALLRFNQDLEQKVRERTIELQNSLFRLQRSDELRRRLLSDLVSSQEEERRRIAADIHDDSIQVMTAAAMRLHTIRATMADGDHRERLDQIETSIEQAIARLRGLMFGLRPPELDEQGLAAALRVYLSKSVDERPLGFEVVSQLTDEPASELRTIAYRVVQEAVTNVRKHARASSVIVALQAEASGLRVTVSDDGAGFDLPLMSSLPGHLGLTEMRERVEMAGGRIDIDTRPGEGTSVTFWLPGLMPGGLDRSKEREADHLRRNEAGIG